MSGGLFRCMYLALCVSLGYIKGAVLVHRSFKFVRVRVSLFVCVYVCVIKGALQA